MCTRVSSYFSSTCVFVRSTKGWGGHNGGGVVGARNKRHRARSRCCSEALEGRSPSRAIPSPFPFTAKPPPPPTLQPTSSAHGETRNWFAQVARPRRETPLHRSPVARRETALHRSPGRYEKLGCTCRFCAFSGTLLCMICSFRERS